MKEYPIPWGGFAITQDDWSFLKSIIDEYGVKCAVEFGSGLSTFLFAEQGITVYSMESDTEWIQRVLNGLAEMELATRANVRWWDGVSVPIAMRGIKPDLVFVDGPRGGDNREHAVRWAAEYGDLIVIHDAHRPEEQAWIDKYVEPDFFFIRTGGNYHQGRHVAELWKRRQLWQRQYSHV